MDTRIFTFASLSLAFWVWVIWLGTMANTLVLAYVGGSLSATVLTVLYNSSLLEVMNKERIAVELMQALIGSIGILFTIPFTCLICALLYKKNEKTM